ncbi:MAG: recombinase family protein [Elusimicrobia bacterium]|nr:recombinase family protein [Elusimicrobiota bacterium]
MQNQTMRYFLYARKSTDEPDRQILSIEGQLAELREYAKKENLIIVKEFIESKTAKEPGREIFNDMVAAIEQGSAQGIISWHPDRLARNSIDGGRIVYLVDTGKITALKFPTFWFDPTPQGKFMLSIAFGQSKYYVDNLSENIRRGFRQKLRNGIWPCCAPLGYLNDKNTRTILPDKDRAVFIRKTFELYASGDYTLAEVRRIINGVGMKGRHTALSTSNYQYMLRNPVYYGVIRYKGEIYEGKHEPIITKALFDRCQIVMLDKSKPKGRPKLKPYTYRGLFRCKECGCLITTETQKGHNYLHCTKRKKPCAEPYVREELIEAQIKGELKTVSLPPALAAGLISMAEEERATSAQAVAGTVQKLRFDIDILNKQMNALLDLTLSGEVTQVEYAQKKRSFIEKKRYLQDDLAAFERESVNRFEPTLEFLKETIHVGELAESGKPDENREKLKKIGSNFRISEKRLTFELKKPWKFLLNFNSLRAREFGKMSKKQQCEKIRRGRDSNPRRLAPYRFSRPAVS